MLNKTAQQRFDQFVNKTNSCWLWLGSINSTGRGMFWWKGKTIKAHRFSWILHYGEIPKNKLVLHKCDVGHCVNPKHLWLGSFKDNTQDMLIKKRQVGNLKITEKQAREIKTLRKNKGIFYKDLAKKYKVHYSTIFKIINNRRKQHED